MAKTIFPKLEEVKSWNQDVKIKYEKELLGFYLTYNPLDKYYDDLVELSSVDSSGMNLFKTEFVQLGGLISDINLRYDKNNNQWAILSLDTQFGNIQVYVFHTTYIKYINEIKDDVAIFIKGKISMQSDDNYITQLIANKIYPLHDIKKRIIRNINIKFDFKKNNFKYLDNLENICQIYKGDCNIMLHMQTSQKRVQKILINRYKTNSSSLLLSDLREIFGNKNVWLS